MLTKREVQTLKSALPPDGYKRIENKTGISYQLISKSFSDPKRLKIDVIQAALEVVEDFKKEVSQLKSKIKEVKTT